MTLYALNLFDLAENDLYRRYSRSAPEAVARHGGRVVALGRLAEALAGDPEPRHVMILVEWPSREAFRAFLDDPDLTDLHPLREDGTRNYLWWTYEHLDDLRPILASATWAETLPCRLRASCRSGSRCGRSPRTDTTRERRRVAPATRAG